MPALVRASRFQEPSCPASPAIFDVVHPARMASYRTRLNARNGSTPAVKFAEMIFMHANRGRTRSNWKIESIGPVAEFIRRGWIKRVSVRVVDPLSPISTRYMADGCFG